MIIEFNQVRSSVEESFEKEQQERLGIQNNSLFNTMDYISPVFLELNTVIDFEVGKVLYNNQFLDCIYPRYADHMTTANILIDKGNFKKLLEYNNEESIYTVAEILEKI